ncbi:MAG: DUF1343 domain-containing protein, partial [Bacteroidetes bacterium]|nr:DUF1343 domain-containing protein [Bacteroidota bacterium]
MFSWLQNCTKKVVKHILFILLLHASVVTASAPLPGAFFTAEYVPLLKGKSVAMVVNQTSTINQTHLVDSLLKLGIKIKHIFAPEHGFRGDHSAGASVASGIDSKTGIPLISLYGKNKKPTPEQLAGVDIVLFDIQDVGVRFYTYISTMHYVMEACAEQNIPLIILDRPNPNGNYIDGPVLKKGFESFVGMHPIPVVHGLTIGELAQMINGEGWLNGGIQCKIIIVKAKNYNHDSYYELPIAPSPNLPNQLSILYYPGLCFFEGTNVSVGRGTQKPFMMFGYPGWTNAPDLFTPHSIKGVADNPPFKDQICSGYDLSDSSPYDIFKRRQLNIDWLLVAYDSYTHKNKFFLNNLFFDKLAGTDELRKQIIAGKTAAQIRDSWQSDLDNYKLMR